MPRKTKRSNYAIQGGSWSPSIFGNNQAIQAFRLMVEVLDKPMPPLILGMSPDFSVFTKASVQKNKKKMLAVCEVKNRRDREYFNDELVFQKYDPSALLVYAYFMMTKGAYLTTKDRLLIEQAIELERNNAKFFSTPFLRNQRAMQLNHLENVLKNYKNGVAQDGSTAHGHKIRLYHTKRGKKRADKASRERSKGKRQVASKTKIPMSDAEMSFWVDTFMMMRLLHGAVTTRKMFKKFAPHVDQNELIYWARMNGMTDSKDRPHISFKQQMMAAIRKRLTFGT